MDPTLSKVRQLVLAAYPLANLIEVENHTFTTLLQLLPNSVVEHFTIHDPAGLDKDIHHHYKEATSHYHTRWKPKRPSPALEQDILPKPTPGPPCQPLPSAVP